MNTALATTGMDTVEQVLIDRIENSIERIPFSGCWIWTRHLSTNGYGRIGMGHSKEYAAHRISYSVFVSPIPEGLCVLHRCDTPACINPAHLFLGTMKDNTADMHRKGRHINQFARRASCPKGHDYSGLNVDGGRICKICQSESSLRYYHRSKAK